jgi:hypothetical protein
MKLIIAQPSPTFCYRKLKHSSQRALKHPHSVFFPNIKFSFISLSIFQ